MPKRLGAEAFIAATDQLLEGFQIVSPDWRYLHVNEAVARQARVSVGDLIGKTMMECFPGIETTPLFATLVECRDQKTARVTTNTFDYGDGTTRDFELRIEPVDQGLCILSIDITERNLAERKAQLALGRLRDAERLISLGRLAAGITHDYNNMLSAVMGLGELALLSPGGPTRADVEEMLHAAKSSRSRVERLLAFGKGDTPTPRPIELTSLASGVVSLMRRVIPANIVISAHVARDELWTRADAGELEHAIMNLVVNARDAMPEGGELVIGVQAAESSGRSELAPGPYARITISDDGMGMSSETAARIFEPFFSTKAAGKGVGLGLSIVNELVRDLGGSIHVESTVGKGTTFEILLPRIKALASGERVREQADCSPPESQRTA